MTGTSPITAEDSRPTAEKRRTTKKHVIPPAIQAERMQRYSVYLIVAAFLLIILNSEALTIKAVLWFAAALSAGLGMLSAVASVILSGLAWNFDRLRQELSGGRQAQDMK